MTPEQRLARLRDADAWTIAPLSLRRAYVPRRQQTLFAQFATVVVTGAVLGGIVVAAVSGFNNWQDGQVVVPATPTPTSTTTPTPTPTAVESNAVPWSSPPVPALGGDCNAVATTAQMAQLMGTPSAALLAPGTGDAVNPFTVVVEHNGGLTCRWAHDIQGDQTFVEVDILPLAASPDLDERVRCRGQNSCGFADAAGEFVIMGTVMDYGSDTTLDTVKAKTEDVVAGLRANLSQSSLGDAPPVWSQRAGDWDAQYECSELADFVDVPHDGGSSNFADVGTGGAEFGGLRSGLGATSCVIGDHMNGATVELLAGGAWIEDRVKSLAGVEAVVVQGADSAYRWTLTHEEGGVDYLFAFAGPNMLTVAQDAAMEVDLLPTTAVGVLGYLAG